MLTLTAEPKSLQSFEKFIICKVYNDILPNFTICTQVLSFIFGYATTAYVLGTGYIMSAHYFEKRSYVIILCWWKLH